MQNFLNVFSQRKVFKNKLGKVFGNNDPVGNNKKQKNAQATELHKTKNDVCHCDFLLIYRCII